MVAGPAAATTSLPTASGTGLAQATSFRATCTARHPLGAVALPWCGSGLPGWLPAGPSGDMPHARLLRGAEEQQHKAGVSRGHRHLPTQLAADPAPVPRLKLPGCQIPSCQCGGFHLLQCWIPPGQDGAGREQEGPPPSLLLCREGAVRRAPEQGPELSAADGSQHAPRPAARGAPSAPRAWRAASPKEVVNSQAPAQDKHL